MTMEKYGVEDVPETQRKALAVIRRRLSVLDGVLEKTASEGEEYLRLTEDATALERAIAAQ